MDKKEKKFAFRVSEKDLNAIRERAAKAEMDVTKYLVTCALNKKIVVIDGIRELTAEVKAIGRNLNQQTTLANMGRITSTDLRETIELFGRVCELLFEIAGRKR